MKIIKENLPKPADVRSSVEELKHWREVRFSRDLPTGALDNALMHLRRFNDLLNQIYLMDLKEDGQRQLDFFNGQEMETTEAPGSDA